MPATDTAEVLSRSVTELGRRVGLTAQEFNVALKHAGLLDGEPGAYYFTELGKRLATVHTTTTATAASPHRSWDITTWPETVIEKLDLSEDGIAGIRQFLADRRAAQWAAIKAERAAADAEFLRKLAAKKASEAAPDVAGGARTWVLVGLGAAAAGYGLYRGWRRCKKRADAADRPRERGERGTPPEDLE